MTEAAERLRRRGDVRSEAVEDGLVVQTADGKSVHLLNATAALIWDRCDGGHSVDDISRELAAATGAELARVRDDVAAAMADLQQKGLLG